MIRFKGKTVELAVCVSGVQNGVLEGAGRGRLYGQVLKTHRDSLTVALLNNRIIRVPRAEVKLVG